MRIIGKTDIGIDIEITIDILIIMVHVMGIGLDGIESAGIVIENVIVIDGDTWFGAVTDVTKSKVLSHAP
tara:strand:- start:1352 stop:1561 length:210 start_codon:yes stop_codon:yes gene_type:complete